MTAVTPVLGSATLATLAFNQRRMFDAIVREDSVLEWGEVLAYGAAAVVSVRVAQHTRGLVGVAYGLLALAAIVAIGEELSWGQRVFHVTTPETLAAASRQQELSLHNLGAAEPTTRLVLLAAALYGATAPLLRRHGPFVPPRALMPAFAIVAAYFAVRFAVSPPPQLRPGEVQRVAGIPLRRRRCANGLRHAESVRRQASPPDGLPIRIRRECRANRRSTGVATPSVSSSS
jgi:hypothetical protein